MAEKITVLVTGDVLSGGHFMTLMQGVFIMGIFCEKGRFVRGRFICGQDWLEYFSSM